MPQYHQTGTGTRDTYPELLDAAMENIWNRKDRHAGVLGQYFQTRSADSDTYKMSSVGSALPLMKENEDTEGLPYVNPAPGFPKTFTLVNYRLAIQVTDTLRSLDRQGKVRGMLEGLPKSAMRLREYQRASIFDNAFSGTAGADSQPLCANSHPHENLDAGTWDNLSTGALNGANLQALRLLTQNMTQETGDPDPVMPADLLTGPANEQKARELIESSKVSENALNANTVLVNSLRLVIDKFISSTTAYFIIGDLEGDERGLYEFENQALNLKPTNPEDPDIIFSRRAKSIHVVDFTVSKNVYGSAGT
jgi:hypothetical protein